MRNNHIYQIFFVDIAFWGFLFTLWWMGLSNLYDSFVEELSKSLGVSESAVWVITILFISLIFVIFHRRIRMFFGDARSVAIAKKTKNRRKKRR